MDSDNVRPLDARRRGRRAAARPSPPPPEGAQLYRLPVPAPDPEPEPEPRPPGDDERPWTREELDADRAAHGWDAQPSEPGPEALTRAQLREDRRKNAHTWRLRAGLFAPRTPADD